MNPTANQAVYNLDINHDDPRVETFVVADPNEPALLGSRGWNVSDRLLDFLPAWPYQLDWRPPELRSVWKPLPVHGRIRAWNDYPRVMHLPAFSRRAIDALRDLLEPNGELLPLVYPHGEFWIYNLRKVVDIVNLDASTPYENQGMSDFPMMSFTHYEIYPERLAGLAIFRLRNDSIQVCVTQPFVDRVRAAGLRNFVFEKIWPWPKGTSWITEVSKLRRKQRAAKRASGIPDARGNTVVIRLLTVSRRMPSKHERELVSTMMDSLDALLADPNTPFDAPVYGNLAGDEPVKGEHRLFLSCPDADRLVERLRTWLHHLDWPGPVIVVKRYGELYDEAAREETLKGPW